MTSVGVLQLSDERERLQALDARASFIVQAPAGSGKTELLIQRYLKLLSVVEKPERISAMTFTRKAAAEMRERILKALARAEAGETPLRAHETLTHRLALEALARGRERGWDILENPGRIKVQTIDSLCGSLVAQMPWLARQGALPEVVEDATPLYTRAAQLTLMEVERAGPHRAWIEHVLLHRENRTMQIAALLTAMLGKREQWLGLAVQVNDGSRPGLEELLRHAVREGHEALENLLSARQRVRLKGMFGSWTEAAEELLTQEGTWRKAKNKSLVAEFSDIKGLAEKLHFARLLPPERYSNEQWKTLRALLETLKRAAVQLRVVFKEAGVVDFCEMALAAREALGAAEDPSDLALKLDARTEHLLIDEFQDTSAGQFELTEALIAGWEPGDGRTIFLVGDPMQSIYRFRQAEVGLFLKTAAEGIGAMRPKTLVLSANYRSGAGIVDWVNRMFGAVFPALGDVPSGAVRYSESYAATPGDAAVTLHAFPDKDRELEAARVVELVRRAREEDAQGRVAVLVRARTHLPHIVEALKEAGLSYQAVKIDDLSQRQAVRDLLSLTRAMLHLGDRVAWLAILRAPWCGLKLADLHALAGDDSKALIYDAIHGDASALTADGRERLLKTRRVMDEALGERGRAALRVWVERTWRALGGAACLESSGDVKDAADYFDLLEREQSGGDLNDFDQFATLVQKLKAQADPQASERLQLMTIHEAKGLQFDTVILPGLGRTSRKDGKNLFLYHEGLLAPIEESGLKFDPIYRYLQAMEDRKSGNEAIRQLYVATTRAKKRLHLLGHISSKGRPHSDSMLADLWEGLTVEEQSLFQNAATVEAGEEAKSVKPAPLRRLPVEWAPAPAVSPVAFQRPVLPAEETRPPTFEWAGDSLRHAGTVVHAVLQRIAKDRAYQPGEALIRTALTQLGIPADELARTTARVADAVSRTLKSERGRWILESHAEARSELRVAGVVNGAVVRGTVDRTFIDSGGTRWVVDFKTSAHEGGGLARFLDEEQRRYREQLERYGRLLSADGRKVRLGLYFPLLDEWREWELRAQQLAKAPVSSVGSRLEES